MGCGHAFDLSLVDNMVRGEGFANKAHKYLEERIGLSKIAVEDREAEYDVPKGLHGRSRQEAAEHTHRMHMVRKQPYSHTEHEIHQRAQEGQMKDRQRAREYDQQLNKKLQACQDEHQKSRSEGGMSWRSVHERKRDANYKAERVANFNAAILAEKQSHKSNTAAMTRRVQARPPINPLNTYEMTSQDEHLKKRWEEMMQQGLEYKEAIKALNEANKPQPPIVAKDDWHQRFESKVATGLVNLKNTGISYYEELNDIDDKLEARKGHNVHEFHGRDFQNKKIKASLDQERQENKKIMTEKAERDRAQLAGITGKIKKGQEGCSKFFPTKFAGYVPVTGTERGLAAKQRMQEVAEYGVVERILGAYGETVRRPRSQPARSQNQNL